MSDLKINTCNYSFQDLFNAANFNQSTTILSKMDQEYINKLVKNLCSLAHWGWEDRIGTDGMIYTAFSPELLTNKVEIPHFDPPYAPHPSRRLIVETKEGNKVYYINKSYKK